MKSLLSVMCCLLVVSGVQAQGAKKFASLDEIDSHFEEATEAAMLKVNKDRLAVLEAFVADKANKDHPDLAKAKAAAVQLKVGVAAKTETSGAALKDAHAKFIGTLENDDIREAIQMTHQVAERLVELDDIANAKAVWSAISTKFADHPETAQIEGLVKSRLGDLETIGTDPKPFKVKDLKGVEQSIDLYKGKVLLIDFWATWCGPCKAELPNVIAAYKKYHPKGLEIVSVSLDRNDKTVLDKFLEKMPDMSWSQIYEGGTSEIAKLYGIQSIPATYLIDQNGKIYRMGLRGKALDKAVEKLLAKAAK